LEEDHPELFCQSIEQERPDPLLPAEVADSEMLNQLTKNAPCG
jgi:hypothetical protein